MFQTLHIFRKDAFHLWPELLVNLVLFLAFAAAAPSTWTGSIYAGILQLVAGLLHILLPIAWLVLISRVIHDEPLVGDRQFWTSRPYHWASLLASKLLFLLAFIYLPFLLMQIYLLKHAGLYPTTVLPDLLHNLLLLTLFFVLPIVTLATVTSSFVRLALSLLAGIVYLVIVGALLTWFSWGMLAPPHLSPIVATLFLAMLAAVLVFQYATRQTLEARLALLSIPVVVALFVSLLPSAMLIRHGYHPLAASNAPKLTQLPDELSPHPNPSDPLQTFRNSVLLYLPIGVSGLDEHALDRVAGYTLTVDAPQKGVHWTSPWQGSNDQINASIPALAAEIPMPLGLFQKIRHTPADLHLTFALDNLKVAEPYVIKATRAPYPVPGHGACTFQSDPEDTDPDSATPTCRFPFQQPDDTFVTATLSPSTCSAAPAVTGRERLGDGGLSLSFDPVQTVPLRLLTGDPNPQHRYLLCPDTIVKFFQAKPQTKGSITFDEKAVTLDPFAARIQRPAARQPPASPQQLPPTPEQP